MKPKLDVWAHIDGTPHAADGPMGCLPCANERRKLTPEEQRKIVPRVMPPKHGPKTREQEETERVSKAFMCRISKGLS